MNNLILLFTSLFFLESLFSQNDVKRITKEKSGKIFCIEEFDTIGSLIFKKEIPNMFQKIEPTIQRDTEIHAVKKDLNGNIEYDFRVHSKLGYLIEKFNYIEGKVVTTGIIADGYYTNRQIENDDLAFLSELSSYSEFIDHPVTKELMDKMPYISNVKQYCQGKIVNEIDLNSEGDTINKTFYSYTPQSMKTTYRRNNISIEHIKRFDTIGRIIEEIRIDSNSHYLIMGQDTSELVLRKYSDNNLLIEKINYKSIGRTANTWYKTLYQYDKDNHIINETSTNIDNQPLSVINYTYKNGLIISEQNIRFTIFDNNSQKEEELINFNYEFY